ncbi:antibiotic biosynthesis monooxygenase [Sulfolobus sp. A20]|uniref:antibiotic biosynthesis monooxygenase family protein n=1 Tax=Sulfolobaceae TaxID=118883 RepID=UPI000845F848|nr:MULTISPECIES: antibiotic biosynthesis monooxygenase [unclassified Sulfolobus]TRM75717.1 antibiotic biosynthesis monooxygenase [Sulfolobus sp. A20-N-F8]TRM76657.1 antibiotic biosynthesis monooxygenase [Sulfolobus sp. E5]TRM78846.1 antibiotic biosynthesis monooxygenase [Sulfolobus sp. B5]TRM81237.1 antibiotic biosynthesis monooxygenase [Sulfolobus sp. D5]TRM83210.1 antibiotic biosynthesis monooxygenase [Sulfolobus sp. F3]TRM83465.1 antibiotic biosynthesis monooxygenase [Sulfolobus sp. A20-N-
MINVGLYYKVKKGYEKDFEEKFLEVLGILKKTNSGLIEAKLYKSVEDPTDYLIYTEWKDIESFKKFTLSEEYKNTINYGKNILEGKPKHRILKELNT